MKLDYTDSRWDELVLFDIETAPKPEIEERFLKKERSMLPERRDPTVPPNRVPSMTEKEVDYLLREISPTEEWLIESSREELSGKSRKGVVGLLKKSLASAQEVLSLDKKICLMPELCDIICIGISISGSRTVLVSDGTNLGDMLREFWAACTHKTPCGWNVASFDLPVILHRSKDCGVVPTRLVEFTYSGNGFVDLFSLRRHTSGSGRLTDVAMALGFQGDSDDPLRNGGADVKKAWSEGRTEDVVAHCEVDLARLEHVFFNYLDVYR